MSKYPGFVGGSAISQSPAANCEETYNLYVEPLPRGAKNQAALYPAPGFNPFLSVSQVGGRAAIEMNGHSYWVIGGTAYEVFATQTSAVIGAVTQDANKAQIARLQGTATDVGHHVPLHRGAVWQRESGRPGVR